MSTSLVIACRAAHSSTSWKLTGSGSSAMASSAASGSPALRSRSTTSCLPYCLKTTSSLKEKDFGCLLKDYDSLRGRDEGPTAQENPSPPPGLPAGHVLLWLSGP